MKTTVFLVGHLHAVRFKLPVICLHLRYYFSIQSRIFILRHLYMLLMKSVFLFLEMFLMSLQFKTDMDGKMLRNHVLFNDIFYPASVFFVIFSL